MSFTTIKSAIAAGYGKPLKEHYGGERLEIKGHTLVRNPNKAKSRTAWSQRGFRIKKGEEAHATVSHRVADGAKSVTYDVYRDDQVEPKKAVVKPKPELIDVLLAVWGMNRYAKRCRDAARRCYVHDLHGFAKGWKKRKEEAYDMKGQALHWLVEEGRLTHAGYHKFGDDFAEVLQGEGFLFHRPCDDPEVESDIKLLEGIEAKPKSKREPRLCDSQHTLRGYLEGRDRVGVFEWLPPERVRSSYARSDEEWEDDDDELDGR